MIPFGIAVSIMGARELWLNVVLPWQERRKLNGACAAGVPQPVKRLNSQSKGRAI
jgi:hypothetical protein